jgi:hypothetical protein
VIIPEDHKLTTFDHLMIGIIIVIIMIIIGISLWMVINPPVKSDPAPERVIGLIWQSIV